MFGIEINFVVTDSMRALAFYEHIFDVERIEVTDLSRGRNEAVFSIYGTRFHILDENTEFQLFAPKPNVLPSLWFNVVVPDIQQIHAKALKAGCTEVQPATEVPDLGVSNSMFTDPFGYLWLLHQIHRETSFEERKRIMEKHIQ